MSRLVWRVLGMTSDERGMISPRPARGSPTIHRDLKPDNVAQVRADDSNTPWRQGVLFECP